MAKTQPREHKILHHATGSATIFVTHHVQLSRDASRILQYGTLAKYKEIRLAEPNVSRSRGVSGNRDALYLSCAPACVEDDRVITDVEIFNFEQNGLSCHVGGKLDVQRLLIERNSCVKPSYVSENFA